MRKQSVFIIIIVATVLGYMFFKGTFSSPKITGMEVALKTATFLDKTIQSDGSFLFGYFCSSSVECFPVHPDFIQNSKLDYFKSDQIINSYLFLEELTGKKSYKDKADKAIQYVLDKCKENKEFCELNFSSIAQYYKTTGNDKYLSAMLLLANDFLSKDTLSLEETGRNLAFLFEATQEEKYKNRLLEITNEEMSNPKGSSLDYKISAAWSLYLPAYEVSEDERYLTAIKGTLDDFTVTKNLRVFRDVTNTARLVDILLSLPVTESKDSIYRMQARDILQELLKYTWDTPENKKFNADYGFINNLELSEGKQTSKTALFNGWLARLFALMQDEVFKIQ